MDDLATLLSSTARINIVEYLYASNHHLILLFIKKNIQNLTSLDNKKPME